MSIYLFDEKSGKIIRQWWWCPKCEVNFFHWIEICPSCEGDSIPKGLTIHGDDPVLQRTPHNPYSTLSDNFHPWSRMRPSNKFQYMWELEPIVTSNV